MTYNHVKDIEKNTKFDHKTGNRMLTNNKNSERMEPESVDLSESTSLKCELCSINTIVIANQLRRKATFKFT